MQKQAEQQNRDKKEKEVIQMDLAHIQREVQNVAQQQQDLSERLEQAQETIRNQQIKTPSGSSISIGTVSGGIFRNRWFCHWGGSSSYWHVCITHCNL